MITAESWAAATTMWFLMMVVMMTPSVWPWWRLLAAMEGRSGSHHSVALRLPMFGMGYFAAWLGYSLLAAALQVAFQDLGLLDTNLRVGAALGGCILIGTGVYQLTPARQACLTHCRNPLSFFLARWADGPSGAFRMGLQHGRYCLGCCWALMLVAFALGLMNLLWMAFLTGLIFVEKVAPLGRRVGMVASWGFIAGGVWMLVRATASLS